MSRIGRKEIAVPAGVAITVDDNNVVTVKGPKGTLSTPIHKNITVAVDSRTLIANMVEGVTSGYSKTLEIVGVGYRAAKSGKTLTLNLGHSHPILFEEKDGITFDVPNSTTVVVNGIDKQTVGQIAAQIREKRPPEPYLGKGVKYSGEYIRRKAGKTGK